MKEINTKRLAIVSCISLVIALLHVHIMNGYFHHWYNGHGIINFEMLGFYILFGYGEMFVSYIVAILLIKYIPCITIKRIIHFILWVLIFSCVENYFIVCFLHMRPGDVPVPGEVFVYIPPFFIKILFYIYYKYKEKQDNKRTQLPSK